MPELTPEELQALLEKLDAVCAQAQELSAEIRKRMIQRLRDDQPSADALRADRRKTARVKT